MYYFVIDEKGLSFSLFWKYDFRIYPLSLICLFMCFVGTLQTFSNSLRKVYVSLLKHKIGRPEKNGSWDLSRNSQKHGQGKCIDIVHQHAKKIATILPPTFVRIACFAHAHGDSACIQASYSWIRLHIAPLSQNLNLSKVCHSFSEGPAQVLWPARVRSAIPGRNSQT